MSEKTRTDLSHLRIITQRDLRLIVPYTPQHILRLEKAGKFPRRLIIGGNRVGWLLTDIEVWIKSRVPRPLSPDDGERPQA